MLYLAFVPANVCPKALGRAKANAFFSISTTAQLNEGCLSGHTILKIITIKIHQSK